MDIVYDVQKKVQLSYKENIPIGRIIKFVWHIYYIIILAVCKYIDKSFIKNLLRWQKNS